MLVPKLIDTAVKTAETGYIQHGFANALEDIMVNYNGTVWSSFGDVPQVIYEEDGMDEAALAVRQRRWTSRAVQANFNDSSSCPSCFVDTRLCSPLFACQLTTHCIKCHFDLTHRPVQAK